MADVFRANLERLLTSAMAKPVKDWTEEERLAVRGARRLDDLMQHDYGDPLKRIEERAAAEQRRKLMETAAQERMASMRARLWADVFSEPVFIAKEPNAISVRPGAIIRDPAPAPLPDPVPPPMPTYEYPARGPGAVHDYEGEQAMPNAVNSVPPRVERDPQPMQVWVDSGWVDCPATAPHEHCVLCRGTAYVEELRR